MDTHARVSRPRGRPGARPHFPKLMQVGRCHAQTAAERFGPKAETVIQKRERVLTGSAHANEVMFQHDPLYWPELDKRIHDETQPSLSIFAGIPTPQTFRSNLTALSDTHHLYFAAYQNRVFVYQLRGSTCTTLPQHPDIQLRPESTIEAAYVGGYVDNYYGARGRSINHMIAGFLGDEEILLMCTDNGDVFAYYINVIAREISNKASSTGPKKPAESDTPTGGRQGLQPFFSASVYKSAWGLAIHQRSRLIAVSSNRAEVTVFAFALTTSTPSPIEEFDKSMLADGLGAWVRMRNRNWRITISLPETADNIPNIDFLEDEHGLAEKIAAVDIESVLWIADIWKPSRRVTCVPRTIDSSFVSEEWHAFSRGWGVLALRDSHFMRVDTVEEMMGATESDFSDVYPTYLNKALIPRCRPRFDLNMTLDLIPGNPMNHSAAHPHNLVPGMAEVVLADNDALMETDSSEELEEGIGPEVAEDEEHDEEHVEGIESPAQLEAEAGMGGEEDVEDEGPEVMVNFDMTSHLLGILANHHAALQQSLSDSDSDDGGGGVGLHNDGSSIQSDNENSILGGDGHISSHGSDLGGSAHLHHEGSEASNEEELQHDNGDGAAPPEGDDISDSSSFYVPSEISQPGLDNADDLNATGTDWSQTFGEMFPTVDDIPNQYENNAAQTARSAHESAHRWFSEAEIRTWCINFDVDHSQRDLEYNPYHGQVRLEPALTTRTRRRNLASQLRSESTTGFGVKYRCGNVAEGVAQGYYILRAYEKEFELLPIRNNASDPCVGEIGTICSDGLRCEALRHSSVQRFFRATSRISMLKHVPELNLMLLGSPTGRVMLVTPTRLRRRKQCDSAWYWDHGMRIECILPRDIDEDKHRPLAKARPLFGMAVARTPQTMSGKADATLPRRYRVMLHYQNHMILSYEMMRDTETKKLFVF